ncbi:prostate androgen-regulated mucin-like protein 1 [Limosa lapponica baueri]|uniref:Prostate androgen-regulated mucin-like protein 1 n=1 Tax=Limosa lapponica baueri TaxID=1758121 RepID=A0A2I0TWM4_LIMLA|nr:prostate androgen-regulated mucin-like protein 1 [Limosa lapponica baueri]
MKEWKERVTSNRRLAAINASAGSHPAMPFGHWPGGLVNDSTALPLAPTSPPFPSERIPEGPGSRDAVVSTPASGQPSLPMSTGPSRGGVSPRLVEGDDHNVTPMAALSPAPASVNVSFITAATVTTADSPSIASNPSLVPPILETAPGLRTANTATLARGTMDLGAAASPTSIPASSSSSSSSLPTSDLYSSTGMVLSPTSVLVSPSTTQPPALTKEFPSLGTLAMASSLAVEPTSPPDAVTSPTTVEAMTMDKTTLSTGVTMEEVPRALSAGSIVAITVTVIVVVVLVFGAAAYLKIRHSSYGRLLDDHDYGSWGNYNNPLYDDS